MYPLSPFVDLDVAVIGKVRGAGMCRDAGVGKVGGRVTGRCVNDIDVSGFWKWVMLTSMRR